MKIKYAFGCAAALSLVLTGCSQAPTTSTSETTAADAGTMTTEDVAAEKDSCKATTEAEIAALFERWNEDLESGDAKKVVENYASESVLLPTVSNQPRTTVAEKEDYFAHWLEKKPSGVVNERWIEIDCDYAIDAGTYTFTYVDGTKVPARYTFVYGLEGDEWKITTHHSSAMPEEGADVNMPVATGSTGSPAPDLSGGTCAVAEDTEITGLFDTWNAALQTGNAAEVAKLYGEQSLLLPTVSNKLRFTAAEKEDYFAHWLEKKPVGTIDQRWTTKGCNTATDAGLYTFKYEDGTTVSARFTYTYKWDGNQWKISSHHSSAMPEG
ncbi:MAG: DUF4440 domain-containing protein [Corynebacterium sp.]|uniref:DUF4440 domain-containing protein n=1 Tax=Corynebacterium sp. TaxID=1720 RepID=UPI0026DDC14D|nr:DUF4440 domain-containing protein [Corynebacterium sp.]MDO4761639.1 DUF4440 domain-containing protein [Corynebacterium sp.]